MKKTLISMLLILMTATAVYACSAGDCIDGQGAQLYTDGVYRGDFKNGQRSGQGRMTYFDGGVYVGEWKNDVPDGRGRLLWQNGIIDGQFKNGQYIGQ